MAFLVVWDCCSDQSTLWQCQKLHIDAGAKSGSAEHMKDFVETLLEFNAELEDTDYKMPQTVLTNHFMNVLSKHDPASVRAYNGAKAGDKDWNKNFDVNWQLIKKDQSVGHLEWKGFDLSEREEVIAKQINQYVPGRENEREGLCCFR